MPFNDKQFWQDWETLMENQSLDHTDYHSCLSALHRLLIHYGTMNIQNHRPIDQFENELSEVINQVTEWLKVQEKKKKDSFEN